MTPEEANAIMRDLRLKPKDVKLDAICAQFIRSLILFGVLDGDIVPALAKAANDAGYEFLDGKIIPKGSWKTNNRYQGGSS